VDDLLSCVWGMNAMFGLGWLEEPPELFFKREFLD
jgi:hypothetical protein